MNFIKTLFASKANWSIFVSIVSGIAAKYGYEITDALQGQLVEGGLTLVSLAAAIYATKRHTDLKIESK